MATKKATAQEKSLAEKLAAGEFTVDSEDAFDKAMIECGTLEIELEQLNAEGEGKKRPLDQKKQEIDLEYRPEIEARAAQINMLREAAEAFAERAFADMGQGTDRETNFAVITKGRTGESVEFLQDMDATIARLKRSPKWRGIVRKKENVLKPDLKKIPEADHERFAFKVIVNPAPYTVRPKRDAISRFLLLHNDRKKGGARNR